MSPPTRPIIADQISAEILKTIKPEGLLYERPLTRKGNYLVTTP